MYLHFFGLTEAPFSITPDPAFVYLSAAHREALAHLLYGIGQGGASGFVQLTGEVGTGKTTLCRCLLEQVPEETQVALILNPLVSPRELLAGICDELEVDITDVADSSKAMVDRLNVYLLEAHSEGRRVVLVIDEAQNLSPEALEQIRLLTNLETSKDKLLQIVLLGQPELRELLKRKSLRQLAQRITARYHLAPLSKDETFAYVRHRMKVAGARTNPFTRSAMRALYQRSEGVPRLINIIADRALVGAYAEESATVGARLVNAAAAEVQPSEKGVRSSRWPATVATASALILVAVTIGMLGLPRFGGKVLQPETGPALISESAVEDPALVEQTDSLPAEDIGSIDTEPQQVVAEDAHSQMPETDPLDDDWLAAQHDSAWQSIADLWLDRGAARSIRSACETGSGPGYSCIRDYGNWSRIRKLGLPVLLVLQGDEPRYLVLRGMTEQGLLVGSNRDARTIAEEEIEALWLGEFVLPWPQADDWPAEIQRGEEGIAVELITEMASFAEPAWQGGNAFDIRFENWLIAFQRRNGLKADGIVGRMTLLYLLAPTITEPRLITSEENT